MLYDKEILENAVKNSTTLKEILDKLGLRDHTFYRRQIKNYIVKYQIDDSSLDCGKTGAPIIKVSLQNILDNKIYMTSSKLKHKLLKAKLLNYYCYNPACRLSEWHGKPISLQLDHIDGNRLNNALENLRLLCPNCHSQTETFGSKRFKKLNTCATCYKIISNRSLYCMPCAGKARENFKIEWPELKSLIQMIEEKSYKETAKRLGVSDNSVRKHLLKLGVDLKTIKSVKRRKVGGS